MDRCSDGGWNAGFLRNGFPAPHGNPGSVSPCQLFDFRYSDLAIHSPLPSSVIQSPSFSIRYSVSAIQFRYSDPVVQIQLFSLRYSDSVVRSPLSRFQLFDSIFQSPVIRHPLFSIRYSAFVIQHSLFSIVIRLSLRHSVSGIPSSAFSSVCHIRSSLSAPPYFVIGRAWIAPLHGRNLFVEV